MQGWLASRFWRSPSAALTRLGPYEIIGHIATGGMATVFRARLRRGFVQSGATELNFSRDFALKVVHPHLSGNSEFVQRFLHEAWLASRLRHPNVAACIDAGDELGYHYLVFELIEGCTLRRILEFRDHPLPGPTAARCIADAARALQALHDLADEEGRPLQTVHRDLSPQNLMIDHRGRTVLIDMGLAKSALSERQTATGVLCGRLPYMSPEQAAGGDVDCRSDIFSLGAVLFELTTGEPPFGRDHKVDTLRQLLECDAQALAQRLDTANVHPTLALIILSCLDRDPSRRFSTATDLCEALEQEVRAQGTQWDELGLALAHEQSRAAQAGHAPLAPARLPFLTSAQRPWKRSAPQALIATSAACMTAACAFWLYHTTADTAATLAARPSNASQVPSIHNATTTNSDQKSPVFVASMSSQRPARTGTAQARRPDPGVLEKKLRTHDGRVCPVNPIEPSGSTDAMMIADDEAAWFDPAFGEVETWTEQAPAASENGLDEGKTTRGQDVEGAASNAPVEERLVAAERERRQIAAKRKRKRLRLRPNPYRNP